MMIKQKDNNSKNNKEKEWQRKKERKKERIEEWKMDDSRSLLEIEIESMTSKIEKKEDLNAGCHNMQ